MTLRPVAQTTARVDNGMRTRTSLGDRAESQRCVGWSSGRRGRWPRAVREPSDAFPYPRLPGCRRDRRLRLWRSGAGLRRRRRLRRQPERFRQRGRKVVAGAAGGKQLHHQPRSDLGRNRGGDLRRAGGTLARRRHELRLRRRLREQGHPLPCDRTGAWPDRNAEDRPTDRSASLDARPGRGRSEPPLRRLGREQRSRCRSRGRRGRRARQSSDRHPGDGTTLRGRNPASAAGRRSPYRGPQPARCGSDTVCPEHPRSELPADADRACLGLQPGTERGPRHARRRNCSHRYLRSVQHASGDPGEVRLHQCRRNGMRAGQPGN